ncbi:unnamed protein product [Mytilus edulis]|uniref:Uncharacterized protein n=1 Tax=Mytilus edulis TaxID=6550 RepID=A0A8S3UZ87_MYTED|nr:unnamed protein product [Mytilus edulis]
MADGFCERLGPSLLIISIASVCYMIGIATPYLIKIESLTFISNSGLWKRCSSSTYGKECYNTSTYAENDWFRICQVMCIFGLVAILTSTACIALRLLKLREHKILQIATIVGVFSAGVKESIQQGKCTAQFCTTIKNSAACNGCCVGLGCSGGGQCSELNGVTACHCDGCTCKALYLTNGYITK